MLRIILVSFTYATFLRFLILANILCQYLNS
jgi:hypothetical protein